MNIKKIDITKLQHLAVSIFNIEDGDDRRGIGVCNMHVNRILQSITCDSQKQSKIFDIIDTYKFDRDWDRTYAALKDAGFTIIMEEE